MIFGRPMLRFAVAAALALGLGTQGAYAADWMINEDYKQLDARGASDFDILLQGDVAGQITGGGKSPVTNPFANPDIKISKDAFGNTVVRFVGSNTIPADPNTDRHVGIYGNGAKPRVLVKAWSFTTDPRRVRVPKSNFAFFYDAGQKSVTITVENTSPDTVKFSEVGYLVSATEHPIEDLTRKGLPPAAFVRLPALDGVYPPGASLRAVLPNIPSSSYILTYATVTFAGASADNEYTASGGEWAQVAAASQTVAVVQSINKAELADPGARVWMILPVVGGLVFAAGPALRRRRRGRRGSRTLPLVLLAALSAGLLAAAQAAANVYVIEILPMPDGKVWIEVNGLPMLVDNGASSPLRVDPGTAPGLGINPNGGTAGQSGGVGGTVPTRLNVPVPAGSLAPSGASKPTTPSGQAATSPPMPTSANVGQTPSPLLGTQWLNQFEYGRIGNFLWLVEKDQGTAGVATAVAMASFLGLPPKAQIRSKSLALGSAIARPSGTVSEPVKPSPPKTLPPGTVAADAGWILGVDLTNLANGVSLAGQPFLIKTGLGTTLITDTLAQRLGLNPAGLPQVTVDGDFGPIKVRQATLNLRLFADPSFPTFTIPVGITDARTNPYGDLVLGQDVIGKLSSWEISAVEGDNVTRFFAAP